MDAKYEIALTCIEIGRRTDDAAALARGEEVLGQMRARVDLSQDAARSREAVAPVA